MALLIASTRAAVGRPARDWGLEPADVRGRKADASIPSSADAGGMDKDQLQAGEM
jgi:hypothetical protein